MASASETLRNFAKWLMTQDYDTVNIVLACPAAGGPAKLRFHVTNVDQLHIYLVDDMKHACVYSPPRDGTIVFPAVGAGRPALFTLQTWLWSAERSSREHYEKMQKLLDLSASTH